jgi:DNA replication and repair protein RecF
MLHIDYFESLVRYHKALKERNKLLSETVKAGRAPEEIRPLLAPWSQILSTEGEVIARVRNHFVENNKLRFKEIYREFSSSNPDNSSGFSGEYPELSYQSKLVKNGGLLPSSTYLDTLDGGFERDLRYQSTQTGIHRDDLEIELVFGGQHKPARASASQGQARSLALSLKLMSAEYILSQSSQSPVILLDDVDSELDSERKHALFSHLLSTKSQVFVTTTDASWVRGYGEGDIVVYNVRDGLLRSGQN